MTKPLPILSHMPRHIKMKIVDSLHTVHKFSLRQCSKDFKWVVDHSTIPYEHLAFEWRRSDGVLAIKRDYGCVITEAEQRRRRNVLNYVFDEYSDEVEFHPRPNGFLRKNKTVNTEVFVENGDFIGAAVEKFVKIFRNRRVFIENFSIALDDGNGEDELYDQRRELIMDKLNESLDVLDHRVAVRRLSISTDSSGNNIRRVLPHLQPGLLECLSINPQSIPSSPTLRSLDLNAIIGMEQWKQTKNVRVMGLYLTLDREATAHLDDLTYQVEELEVDDLNYMILNFLRENGWIARSVRCRNCDYATIKQYLSQMEGPKSQSTSSRFEIRHDGFECTVIVDEFFANIEIYKKYRPPW